MLDAIIIGAGPSGLGASMALSGYLPYHTPACVVEDGRLQARLQSLHEGGAGSGPIQPGDVPRLSSGLRGRSNNPLALLFDALQHPGCDSGWQAPPCLELRKDRASALTHLLVDPALPGGSWHGMHDATKTLSPGPWMELPGYSLADYFQAADGRLGAEDAAAAAQQLQLRGTIAAYYEAAAKHLALDQHHRPWRVESIVRSPALGSEAASTTTSRPTWTVSFADGVSPPLRARAVVLAIGTYGVPRRLGIPGEELGLVAHGYASLALPAGPSGGAEGTKGASLPTVPTVLVVGAGLSAADCIVDLLRSRRAHVLHAFRGEAETTKVGSKFGAPGAARMYPEYAALVGAMRRGGGGGGGGGPADGSPLLGGRYTPLAHTVLRRVHPDGRCELGAELAAASSGKAHPQGGDGAHAAADASTMRVDAVAILIGSAPDLSFLPPDVASALAAAGPPPNVSAEGVAATHPVYMDVDPYTMEAKAVPGLHALGPLRGDNFARFAIFDGLGVAGLLRTTREESEAGTAANKQDQELEAGAGGEHGGEDEQEACEAA